MEGNGRSRVEPGDNSVAIYHVVYSHEDFNHAATTLFELVRQAERVKPGMKRKLFLDIEGHRNSEGGFDGDMFELQQEFLLGFLSQFLAEIHSPLVSVTNSQPQIDDIPERLDIHDNPDKTS